MINANLTEPFLSTLSVRRATKSFLFYLTFIYISIHALREESDYWWSMEQQPIWISIHALREESDGDCTKYKRYCAISIHALREESDPASTV